LSPHMKSSPIDRHAPSVDLPVVSQRQHSEGLCWVFVIVVVVVVAVVLKITDVHSFIRAVGGITRHSSVQHKHA